MRSRRFSVSLSLLCTFVVYGTSAVSAHDDITLKDQNLESVTFQYQVGDITWLSGAEVRYPRFDGGAILDEPGYPTRCARIVYVAVPDDCRSVTAQLIDYSAPTVITDPVLRTAPDPHGEGPIPERVVVDRIVTLRDQRVARIWLHPVLTTDGEEYSVLESMTVRVQFDRPGHLSKTTQSSLPSDKSKTRFDNILSKVLVNPDQADGWRQSTQAGLAKAETGAYPFAGAEQWIAIRTREDGPTVIIPTDLSNAGVNLNLVDPRNFRMFAGPGRQLPRYLADSLPTLAEIPIAINGTEDGEFNGSDQLVFWADALNRWELEDTGEPVDVKHRYTRDNVYWLAVEGDFPGEPVRLQRVESPTPNEGDPNLMFGTGFVRYEEDEFFRISSFGDAASYYSWYWENARTREVSVSRAVHAMAGQPAQIAIRSSAGLTRTDPARLVIDGALTLPTEVQSVDDEDATTRSIFAFSNFDPTARYVLDFEAIDTTGRTVNYLLDRYTITYSRRLDLSGGAFRFALPDTTTNATIVVSNGNAPELWDITEPSATVVTVDPVMDGNASLFPVVLTAGTRRLFYAVEASDRRRPRSVELMTPVDWYTSSSNVDYLIIGPRTFSDAMSSFADYRTSHDGLVVQYVPIEDIITDFALGVYDPSAIRRFLLNAHTQWPTPVPTYVLLVGDGTFDYLNYMGTGTVNYVPPIITADDGDVVSDDRYVYFSDRDVLDAEGDTPTAVIPDMMIGRWPVRTSSEIAIVIDKIKRYESSENLGPWRSRVMMVADDEFGDRNLGRVTEVLHTEQAEEIVSHIPPRFDLLKNYLMEFPFDNPSCANPFATGCHKPTAREAIVSGLNDGVLIFDYVGHGNRNQLAHENVFSRAQDLPRLTNTTTPTAVLTFSCSIGFFDDPSGEGMAEEWFRMPGGAVCVVSATRLSASRANAALNEEVFDLLFNQDVLSIGDALYIAKLNRQYFATGCGASGCPGGPPCPCQNDRGYILFGDPVLQLGLPTNRVSITRVSPDTLTALQLTQVEGEITDVDGEWRSDFNGDLKIVVRDVPRRRVYTVAANSATVDYDLAGGTLYRSHVPVDNGRFSFQFVVPKDIAYGDSGASILGHASSDKAMASGAATGLLISADAGELDDTTGPVIRMLTDDGELITDGFRLAVNAAITVDIEDDNGINLTGAPGHRLELSIDDNGSAIDLTDEFVYDPGAFNKGTVLIALNQFGEGPRRLAIKAWDNANNSSAVTVDVDITSVQKAGEFTLTEFINYPNPFTEQTTFYFRATRAVTDATIRVFTLAGRKIWERAGARDGAAVWPGTDQEGRVVANGVYLAQIEATGQVVDGGRIVDKTAYREAKLVISR